MLDSATWPDLPGWFNPAAQPTNRPAFVPRAAPGPDGEEFHVAPDLPEIVAARRVSLGYPAESAEKSPRKSPSVARAAERAAPKLAPSPRTARAARHAPRASPLAGRNKAAPVRKRTASPGGSASAKKSPKEAQAKAAGGFAGGLALFFGNKKARR